MNGAPPGRRLGERYPVQGVNVWWRVGEAAPRTGRGRRHRRLDREPRTGTILNASVSGAAVIAPADDDVRLGSVVVIDLGGATAVGRIRRVGETLDPAYRLYGLEFVETEPAFLDWLNLLTAAHRGGNVEAYWQRAR